MYKKKFKLELDKAPISKSQTLWNAIGISTNFKDHNFLVCFLSLPSLTQLCHLTSVVVHNSRKHLKPLHKYSTETSPVPNAAEEKFRLEQMKYKLKQAQYKRNFSCMGNQNNIPWEGEKKASKMLVRQII